MKKLILLIYLAVLLFFGTISTATFIPTDNTQPAVSTRLAKDFYFPINSNLTKGLMIVNQDIEPPIIISHTPSGTITDKFVTLSVTTNETAVCKYSINRNVPYDDMLYSFSVTGETRHTVQLTDLEQKDYYYYIRCKDESGNTAGTDYIVRFTVNLPPAAWIELSDSSPVRAGTLKVTVTTTEEVQQSPVLSVGLGGEETILPLAGAGNTWIGFIVIEESDSNKAGYFKFSGTDLSGLTGTTILSGKIFLVDTTKPDVIATINALSNEDGDIKLRWYYDGGEISSFKIFRSTVQEVDQLDFYEKTEKQSVIDSDVEPGKTYYYKVAAVDKAGNEGPLSREVHATVPIKDVDLPVEKKLASELAGEVDSAIMEVNQAINEAEVASANLESNPKFVGDLGLITKIDGAKSDLAKLMSELEGLKSQDLTRVELGKKINRINLEMKLAQKKVAEKIVVIDEIDFNQETDLDELKSVIVEAYPDATARFISSAQDLQGSLDVKAEVTKVSVGYIDGSEEYYTIINNYFLVKDVPLSNSLAIIMRIPKSIAENTDEIEFKTQGYELIKKDPVIKWPLEGDSKTTKLIINKQVNLDDIKKMRSILVNLEEKANNSPNENKITGYVSLGQIANPKILAVMLLIIVGLLGYYIRLKKVHDSRPKKIYGKTLIKKIGLAKIVSSLNNWLQDSHHEANKLHANEGTAALKEKEELLALLNKACHHVSKREMAPAQNAYFDIVARYNKLQFHDASEKSSVHQEIAKLYDKLTK